MSYGMGSALQAAVFAAISGDATVQSLVGANVFDALPPGVLPLTYVVLGEEDVRARSDISAKGARHEFTISVVSDAAGFAGAKSVAVAISDVLIDANLVLSRGILGSLDFKQARARRGKAPDGRRIDLRFSARVDDI